MTRDVEDSPSARIIKAAGQIWDVQDAVGRVLSLRRLGALEKLRLFKAVGPALAQNAPYLGMAVLASAVVAIDGVPVPAPASEQQLEALIARLGDDGIAAIASGLQGQVPQAVTPAIAGN